MVLTIIQIFILVLFTMAGLMKSMTPKKKFEKKMTWAKEYTQDQLRVIGALEILGAWGMMLPVWLDTATWVAPLSTIGLALVTLMAVRLHVRRKETPNAIFAGAIFLLLAYVVWQTSPLLGL